METLVVVVVALWAVRRLIVDGAFAVRGRTPPTMARRQAGRYGARAYFGDVWSDAWRSASTRRQARRERRAAGLPGRFGRWRQGVAGWWRTAGGSRELHRGRDGTLVDTTNPSRWDRAWTRTEERHAARAAHRPARRPAGTRPAAGPAGPTGPAGPARPAPDTTVRPAAGPDFPPARPNGAAPDPQPGTGPGSGPASDQRQGGTDPGAGPGSTPDAAPERDRPNGSAAPTNTNHREGNAMAEATGLTTAISYADAQKQAAEGNAIEVESWIASLEAHEVSGEAIAAARRAMELYQSAGASFDQARGALQRHLQVKESYDANPDAGSREFVTRE